MLVIAPRISSPPSGDWGCNIMSRECFSAKGNGQIEFISILFFLKAFLPLSSTLSMPPFSSNFFLQYK
uniref:Uncharacterized protein n=1 Tax=Lepeophtheirus salmonis TaxID=72036 RepID=A0A0K2TYQ9_LEPSM